jgi:hypothetical protein
MDAPLQIYHSLTQHCNWKCYYCEFPTLENPITTNILYLKDILSQIKEITKHYNIEHCVEGGEIGLLNIDLLDVFFNSGLSKTYHVATNGTFMKRGYHKRYCDKIHTILYHVKPEIINTTFDFIRYQTYGIKFYYTIVITKENINVLEDFLNYNNDISFVLHVLQQRRRDITLMDINYYNRIYDIVKDKTNVDPGFIKRYKYITDHFKEPNFMETRNKLCCNDYTKIMIDYNTKSLIRCCISTETSKLPLTLLSLKRILDNDELMFPVWDRTCEKCIAHFVFKDITTTNNKTIVRRPNLFKILKKINREFAGEN